MQMRVPWSLRRIPDVTVRVRAGIALATVAMMAAVVTAAFVIVGIVAAPVALLHDGVVVAGQSLALKS